MAKISVLVDTDIFIDYFNASRFHALFDSTRFTLYYSIIRKKELLGKPGLRDSERKSILDSMPIDTPIFAAYILHSTKVTRSSLPPPSSSAFL